VAENPAAATALGPVVLAAIEALEPPRRRLVDDPLATWFLPRRLRALVSLMRIPVLRRGLVAAVERSAPGIWASIACRKRLIDERLTAALGDVGAVVTLGAGLDTRAYRLTDARVRAFEVDQPINIALKDAAVRRALPAQPWITLVPIDFEHDDLVATLAEHGFDPTTRTFFVWEGVTQYLTPEAVRSTLDRLHNAPSGSVLMFTYVRRDFIDGTNSYGASVLYRRFRQRSQVWRSGLDPGEVGVLLDGYGWRLRENIGPDHYVQNYIRPTGRNLTASQIEWCAVADKV
jgi:methyltransferase (TIGR00027 family)